MKIRVGTLRRLIREVTLSPSLAKNKTLDNVMDDHDTSDLAARLGTAFEHALMVDLVVREFSKHYDASTRNFDDAAYDAIKSKVEEAKNQVVNQVKSALEQAWEGAHQEAAAPRSSIRPTQRPPARTRAA